MAQTADNFAAPFNEEEKQLYLDDTLSEGIIFIKSWLR